MESDDDLSYSFYVDNNGYLNNSYTDSEIINNCKNEYSEEEPDVFINEFINSPPDPFSLYSKRTREKWVDDNSVEKCKHCKSTFRIYRRRHHCRNCSDVFCDTCSSYREKIPKVIKKIPTRSGKEEPRSGLIKERPSWWEKESE